jgi:hypothetical protein
VRFSGTYISNPILNVPKAASCRMAEKAVDILPFPTFQARLAARRGSFRSVHLGGGAGIYPRFSGLLFVPAFFFLLCFQNLKV